MANRRAWRYYNQREGWTKVVTLPLPRDFTYLLRYFPSGGAWSAAVYRGTLATPSALAPGTRSRHASSLAAQRKLLAWVRRAKQEVADGPH